MWIEILVKRYPIATKQKRQVDVDRDISEKISHCSFVCVFVWVLAEAMSGRSVILTALFLGRLNLSR